MTEKDIKKGKAMTNINVMIIGANEFQKQIVLKAKELGYQTHVVAWEQGACAKSEADFFYPISITEKEEILKIAQRINPVGILSVASDLAVPTVSHVAEALGLPGNSTNSALISTNKFEMRKSFSKHNICCPQFALVDSKSPIPEVLPPFPLIVKPVDRSGSRGVCKVTNPEELQQAVHSAAEVSFVSTVLIEEFVEGQEYSMEMLSYKGEHYFLALTEKFTTSAPNFVETMHLQPGRIDQIIQSKAIEVIKQALTALQIEYGASHAEFKVNSKGDIRIIEIGARMGGDYIGSDLVPLTTGYDFKKMVIDTAVGLKPQVVKTQDHYSAALVKFIFSQEDIAILNRIKEACPQRIHRIGELTEITGAMIKDSSARHGYFIIVGDNVNECLDLVKQESLS